MFFGTPAPLGIGIYIIYIQYIFIGNILLYYVTVECVFYSAAERTYPNLMTLVKTGTIVI